MMAETPPLDDGSSLFGALCDGDAETAGKLMKGQQALAPEEIDLIADLLLGNEALRKSCSHRLVFKRWGPGRPTDSIEQRAKSQERARAVERLVRKGIKVEAALAEISERTHTPISTLKKDRQLEKERQPKK